MGLAKTDLVEKNRLFFIHVAAISSSHQLEYFSCRQKLQKCFANNVSDLYCIRIMDEQPNAVVNASVMTKLFL